MKKPRWAILILAGIVLAVTARSWIAAEEPPPVATAPAEPTKFVRVERDKSGEPLALQTAIVRFASAEKGQQDLAVDLIAAIHVGDKSYYEALNKAFENYDVVLYELVAPEGTRVPKGSKTGGHPVAMLQNGMKGLLGLEHQLENIDYTKQNLLHADMSPDDFSKSMSDRNESFMSMYFRMLGQAMAQQAKPQRQSKSSEGDMFAALFSTDRAGAMKRMMADQMENMEGAMGALDGPQGSTIVTERNKVALKKLAAQIADGKKKIGIFYGAAHLPDMEKHLVADFHLRRASENWVNAWNLDKPVKLQGIKTPLNAAPDRTPQSTANP